MEAPQSPFLMASLGTLRFPAHMHPLELTIGGAPECDLVLSGPFSKFISRKHCVLRWDGSRLTIMDLQTVNGTWVNLIRLHDGETRVLKDKDVVHLTFAAFGLHSRNACESILALTYREHTFSDISATLSSGSCVVRKAMDELSRIRETVKNTRHPRSNNDEEANTTSAGESVRTYRGVLDRLGRVRTPVLPPPQPLDLDREDMRMQMRNGGWGRKSTSEKVVLRRDDPNIIWGTSCVSMYAGHGLPDEIKKWSNYHHLPVGLHDDWPLVSPTPYGCRSSLPWPKRRERYVGYLAETGRPDFAPDHSGSVLWASRYAPLAAESNQDPTPRATSSTIVDQQSTTARPNQTNTESPSRGIKRRFESDDRDVDGRHIKCARGDPPPLDWHLMPLAWRLSPSRLPPVWRSRASRSILPDRPRGHLFLPPPKRESALSWTVATPPSTQREYQHREAGIEAPGPSHSLPSRTSSASPSVSRLDSGVQPFPLSPALQRPSSWRVGPRKRYQNQEVDAEDAGRHGALEEVDNPMEWERTAMDLPQQPTVRASRRHFERPRLDSPPRTQARRTLHRMYRQRRTNTDEGEDDEDSEPAVQDERMGEIVSEERNEGGTVLGRVFRWFGTFAWEWEG
ncbi:unnamed protein product [Peniophora sp. CBMAI 1063]|nr:unnamed protein product [Peniophora sp. CBMAI 1063]